MLKPTFRTSKRSINKETGDRRQETGDRRQEKILMVNRSKLIKYFCLIFSRKI
ncbi:MAG: hypothetical protein AB4080_03435 [Trichodesmium sp.]